MGRPTAPLQPLTQQQAAQLIGKRASWLRDNSAPRLTTGKYDPKTLVSWFLERETAHLTEKLGRESEFDAEAELAKLRHYQAAKAKLEHDVKEGLLVPIEDVRDGYGTVAALLIRCGKQAENLGADAAAVFTDAVEELADIETVHLGPKPGTAN